MKVLSLKQILDLPSRNNFLVETIFANGELNAMVGSSDTGKSQCCYQLSVAIANGDSTFLGLKLSPKHKRVLIVPTEDSVHNLKKRFTMLMQDHNQDIAEQILFITDTDSCPLQTIQKKIGENPVDLIIIDHWMDLFEGDQNNSAHVREFLKKYKALAEENDTCILFLHHFTKSSEGKKHTKKDVIGSQSFEAKLRSVVSLETNPVDLSKQLTIIKGNLLSDKEKRDFCVRATINEHWQFVLLEHAPNDISLDRDQRSRAEKFINEHQLINLIAREIERRLKAEGIKYSKSSIDRYKKRIGAKRVKNRGSSL